MCLNPSSIENNMELFELLLDLAGNNSNSSISNSAEDNSLHSVAAATDRVRIMITLLSVLCFTRKINFVVVLLLLFLLFINSSLE